MKAAPYFFTLRLPSLAPKKTLRGGAAVFCCGGFSSVKSTIKLNSIPFLEQTERKLLKCKIQNENSRTAIKFEF